MCRKIIAVILLIAMSLCLFVGCRKNETVDDGPSDPKQPNFNYVTYESDGKTYLLNADTGETTYFFDGTGVDEVRMTNSGRRLFFSVDSSLYVWNVDSTDAPKLITDQLEECHYSYSKGAFEITADGNEVIYTTKTGEGYDLYRSDLKSSQKLAEDIFVWAMSNDGNRIIYLKLRGIPNQSSVQIGYDAYFISKSGKAQLIAEGISRTSHGSTALPPTVVDDCSALVFMHPGTGYNDTQATYIWHANTQKTEHLFDSQVFHAISSTEIYYESPTYGSDKNGNWTLGTLYYYDGKGSKRIAENVGHVYRIGEHYMSYYFDAGSSYNWGIAYKGNSIDLGSYCAISIVNGYLPLYDETQETLYYNQDDRSTPDFTKTLYKISVVAGKPQVEATNITNFDYTPRRGFGLCDGVFWHYASVNGKRGLYRNGESVAEQYDEFAPVDKNSVAYTFEETLYFYANGSTESIATNVVWLGKAFNGSVLYLTSDSSLYLYRNGKSTLVSDNVSSTSDINIVLAQDERDYIWLARTHTSFDSDYFESPFRGYT